MSIEALIDVQQGGEGRVGLFLSTRVVPSTKAPDDTGIRLYWVPAEMFIRKMRHVTLLSSRQEITVISLVCSAPHSLIVSNSQCLRLLVCCPDVK